MISAQKLIPTQKDLKFLSRFRKKLLPVIKIAKKTNKQINIPAEIVLKPHA
tara:strand:- start:121 stop:273 length:153 start_codon:yes stop_codon:yes gene_type:complete